MPLTVARRTAHALAALTLAVVALACGGGSDAPDGVQVTRETRGDTAVVRTLGPADAGLRTLVEEVAIGELEGEDVYTFGSIDDLAPLPNGGVVVWDGQAKALREYGADGQHVRTFGRPGKGPGEIESANGIAVLPDGRVGVWDGQNARLTVFTREGAYAEEVRIPGGFFSQASVYAADSNSFWIRTPLGGQEGAAFFDRKDGVRTVRLTGASGSAGGGGSLATATPMQFAEGSPAGLMDSVLAPVQRDPSLQLQATSPDGRGRSSTLVPFLAGAVWTPGKGHMLSSPGGEYRVDVWRPGAPVRIERELPAIPVTDGERSAQEARVTWSMQRTQPGWSWNGPPIPATKPAIRSLRVDVDGRIWVWVSQPGEQFEPEPPSTTNPNPAPVLNWREPVTFDVFAPEGDFLGRIPFPQGTRSYSIRGASGNHVWGVLPDSFGVDRVVRWRVEPALTRE